MPCIFCIAVIAMIAGAMAAGAVDSRWRTGWQTRRPER